MNRERLGQIRQAIDHNPRGADGYVDELLRACAKLLGEVDVARIERDRALESLDRAKARGDFAIEVRRDLVDVIQRVAESLGVSAEALIEDPSVAASVKKERDEALVELARSREGRRSPIVESREVAGRDRVALRVCLDRDSAFDGSSRFSVALRIGRKRQQAFPLTEWTESREAARTEAVRLLRALADELRELRSEVTP